MERLFIYLFIGLILLAGFLFYLFRKFIIEENQESNFGPTAEQIADSSYISPAPREHVAYIEQQSSIIIAAIKKAPKTIMTTIFIQLFLMIFTGYLSVKNIERLAMAGSAIAQGDYGMAISALWPIGKEAGVEQWRVASGSNPYLDDNGITNFSYVGQKDGKSYAVMERLYSTQDHDSELKESDESYGDVILGQSPRKANSLCRNFGTDDNPAKLLSKTGWKLSRVHFIAARNVKEYPDIPEWTNEVSVNDTDDYLIIPKESGILEYAEKHDIDREDGGYIDGDDIDSAGFRCEITW